LFTGTGGALTCGKYTCGVSVTASAKSANVAVTG
jgi:hypothetical protein